MEAKMGPPKADKSHLRIFRPTLGAQGAEKGVLKIVQKIGPQTKTKKWTLRAPTGQILTPPWRNGRWHWGGKEG